MEPKTDASRMRAVILPVGITPDPVIFTIEKLQPEFLGLIGTPQSERTMDVVFARIPFPPHRVKHVSVLDSPDKIGELVCHVYDLYRWLHFEKGLAPDEIAIDPTPGRKWMSAGATMVASHLGLPMFYVGVDFVDGRADPESMRLVRLGNAYDQTGFLLADRARTMFNLLDFAAAAETYSRIRPSRAQEAEFYEGMALLSKTLHRWDLFEHYEASLNADFRAAVEKLNRHVYSVAVGAEFHEFVETVGQLAAVIEELSNSPRPSLLAVVDLVHNAKRKIAQGRYDDAVARLYRAFEAISQFYLKTEFAIDASNPAWDRQSASNRQAAQHACGQLPAKIANVHGWSILRELGHPAAMRVFQRGRKGKWRLKLEGLLQDRNDSILAHGWKPLSAERAEKMLDRMTRLLDELGEPEMSRWIGQLVVPRLPSVVVPRE